MPIETIRNHLPEFAKDLKLNLGSVLTESGSPDLNNKQIAAVALACAMAARNAYVYQHIVTFAEQHLDANEIAGAKMAASLMSMTNIYYRFTHLVTNQEYASMPARLRMNGMANPGIDKVSFELASIAVSSINGCAMCLDSHEKNLMGHGVTTQAIQSSIRIAAVIFAVAVTLDQGHNC